MASCASVPPPTAQIAVSKAAVAHASNAATTEFAPVELQSAKDKLARAEQAMAKEDYALARQIAEEAQADARLAEAKSETAQAQKAAQDSQDASRVLREDAKVVDSLAYVAKQKIALAHETAERKNAELTVSKATAERNRLLLQARTSEADHANHQAAIAQDNAQQMAAELDVANAVTQQQQRSLDAKTAEANQARQQTADAQARAAQDQASLAAMQARLNELNAKQTARGMVITLGDVLFDTNQANLKSGGTRNVQKLAEFLKQYPRRKVLIEGFTDSIGSNSANQVLSEQRASAVSMALVDLSVGRDRVNTKGYGEAYAVASNDNAAGRQLNRRVEIVLSDENGTIAPR